MNHECLSVLVNRQQFWRNYLMSVCLWKIRFKKLILSNIKEQFWSVCPNRWSAVTFVRNSDVCSKLWNLFETLTFVRNSDVGSKFFPAGHFSPQVEGWVGSQGDDVVTVSALVRGLEVGRHEKVRLGRKQFQLKYGNEKILLNCFNLTDFFSTYP